MIYAFFTAFKTTFATPHKTIANIGFILNLRSSTNAITKNMIISTHTFWRIRFTVPSMKNAEIKIVTPALAIIDTTAGLRDASTSRADRTASKRRLSEIRHGTGVCNDRLFHLPGHHCLHSSFQIHCRRCFRRCGQGLNTKSCLFRMQIPPEARQLF